jgi:succinate dehydrogenase / fumarate reductase flavoprotein subunit
MHFCRLRGKRDNPYDVQFGLQDMMQQLVGIVRNEKEMQRAKEHLRLMSQRVENVSVTGNREFNPGWHTALDLRNMLIASEAITMAALERKESRGAHFREDYPDKDPKCGKYNLVIKKNANGQMEIRQEPIPEITEELKKIIEEMK